MILRAFILVLLCAGIASAAPPKTNGVTPSKVLNIAGKVNGVSGSSGASYLYQQNFESNSTCSSLGFTTTGTVSCQHSSSGLSMGGDYVFRADSGGEAYHTFTATSSAYAVLRFRIEDALESSELFVSLRDSGGNVLCRLQARTDTYAVASDGTLTSGAVIAGISADTTKWIKVFYVADTDGGGASAVCGVGYWNGSSWATQSITNSAKTANAAQIFINNWQDGTGVEYQYWDDIYVDDVDITSDPSSL